ncbi:hypothetical protein HOY80DRAFT_1088016 [Tuber brumale]|nr:hypothetical protein HOY80DRAFT_1088016 [Tuber brumale]
MYKTPYSPPTHRPPHETTPSPPKKTANMLIPQYILVLLFPYLTLTQPIHPAGKALANANGTHVQTTPHLQRDAPTLLPRGNMPSKPFKGLWKKIKKLSKGEDKEGKKGKKGKSKKDKKKDRKRKDRKGKGKEIEAATIFAPGPDNGWWELKLDGPDPKTRMALPTILAVEYHKNSMSPMSPVEPWSPPRPPLTPTHPARQRKRKPHAKMD